MEAECRAHSRAKTDICTGTWICTVKPGQPIRFPVEANGRFEPVTANTWFGTHSINVPDMQMLDDTGAAVLKK